MPTGAQAAGNEQGSLDSKPVAHNVWKQLTHEDLTDWELDATRPASFVDDSFSLVGPKSLVDALSAR